MSELVDSLLTASDDELLRILADADTADIAMRTPAAGLAPHRRVTEPGTTEVVLLGALGCRYGMLAGGAGGHLVRTATTTVLVDPGPAALGMLLDLAASGQFDWRELDAIAVTHLHPDHYAGLIPALEAMCSYAPEGARKLVLANPTTTTRFTAFSPYHFGHMADVITLAHPDTEGDGKPAHTVGDITVHATPALHLEETGRRHSAIGLAYQTNAADIWYTSDTNLTGTMLDAVAAITSRPALVIAHADASNITQTAQRGAACHLETRDVPTIAAALRPGHLLVQHYDAAYSTTAYRLAQAIWLQRRLDTTTVLPGIHGLSLTLQDEAVKSWTVTLPNEESLAIESYLSAASPGGRRTDGAGLGCGGR